MNLVTFFIGMEMKNVLLLSVGTVNFVFALLIYFTDRHKEKNIFFSLLAVSVSLWVFSMAIFYYSTSLVLVSIISKCLYLSAASFPFFLFFLVESIDGSVSLLPLRKKILAILIYIWIVVLINIPDFIISPPDSISVKEFIFGPGYIFYGLYILIYFFACFYLLLEKYYRAESPIVKKQILFLFTGTFSASLICVMTDLVLPYFGWWNLYWFGPVTSVIMTIFVGYSTIRHNLFNIKSVAVESVTFVLWVAMLMRLFLSGSIMDLVVNSILFTLVVGGGLILINTVYREIDQSESLRKIAEELEVANEHLREMDKKKSEFVSIASHQLRTPVTVIIGYSSMLLEGTYGQVSVKTSEVVTKVYESGRRLAAIIDDFLTISHIEQGEMSYKFETVEMRKMIGTLLDEFLVPIQDKKLFLHFTTDNYDTYNITADVGKIRQVFSNLLDNAIKYTATGGIEVRLMKDTDTGKTLITITDTGMGLSQDTISNLFQKFSRAKEVQKVYTDGSGIGLYIAQEIVKAHHGRIWIESEGEGKGSKFLVELMSEE